MVDKATTGTGSRASSDCKSFMSDEERLEQQIHAAHARIVAATSAEAQRAAYDEMVALIGQRTPARRRFMERMRTL